MNKDDFRSEAENDQIKTQLYGYAKVAIAVAALVVLCCVVWHFVSPYHSREKKVEASDTVSITAQDEDEILTEPVETINPVILTPETEDGTGAAGICLIQDGRDSTVTGWAESDGKRWYAPDAGKYYYNGWQDIDGATYHFDAAGYAAKGWTAISYQNGCYFDEECRYVPDKDKSKMICLTFDDGPTELTSQVLDILESNGAVATFFLLGVQIEQFGDVLPRMIAGGNMIGNHSYDHTQLLDAPADTVQWEFAATDELIAQYNNGAGAAVVRFPYGDYTPDRVAVTGRANILWDNDTYDWDTTDPAVVIGNLYHELDGGNIILMHDMYDSTIEACRQFIPDLVSQGYEFVTLDVMAASRGYNLEAGRTYFGFKQSNLEQGRVNDG